MSWIVPLHVSRIVCLSSAGFNLLVIAVFMLHSSRRRTRNARVAEVHESPWEEKNNSLTGHDKRVHKALSEGTIRLLKCAWLREQPPQFKLSRRQELPEEAFCSENEAAQLFEQLDRRVCVLSYGWLTALHCDPHGLHAARVVAFLNSEVGQHYEGLFWEYASQPLDSAAFIL